MEKITSFTIDHIKLIPGVYVSRVDYVAGHPITTFDLRMTSPNDEPVMNTAEMHTVEHLAATFLRNHAVYGDKSVYFGPMGCRTGFYLVMRESVTKAEVLMLIADALKFIADYKDKIPGCSEEECGNFREHNLKGANAEADEMLKVLIDWNVSKMKYAD